MFLLIISLIFEVTKCDWSWDFRSASNFFVADLSSIQIDFDNTENIILKDIIYIYIYRNITESQIDELFSKFGNIVQKNILRDKLTGLPRGVAFVR